MSVKLKFCPDKNNWGRNPISQRKLHNVTASLKQPIKVGEMMSSLGNHRGLIAPLNEYNNFRSFNQWSSDYIWIPLITIKIERNNLQVTWYTHVCSKKIYFPSTLNNVNFFPPMKKIKYFTFTSYMWYDACWYSVVSCSSSADVITVYNLYNMKHSRKTAKKKNPKKSKKGLR